METLNSLYAYIVQLSKDSPIIAGLVSLWGMAVITFLLRNVPTTVYHFVSRQVTTSLEFNNAGWGANQAQFNSFMKWYSETGYFRWSRYLALESTYVYDDKTGRESMVPTVGPGYGRHFFCFNKRLFWFEKLALESSGSDKEKQTIKIYTFGRDKDKILDLIESFRVKEDEREISVYVYKDGWNVLTTIKKRSIESVILNKDLKEKIVSDIRYFYDNPEWYLKKGFAHKQTYVLHGAPGTGKSSTIKALASYFEKNICVLDMADMSGASFEKAMATAPKGSFILAEDFDACMATGKREGNPEKSLMEELSGITLSKILNVLDGVVSLDGTVIFLTTNHLDHLDPALIRTGRVDYCHEIKALEDAEVKDYIALMYGEDNVPKDVTFATITGSDIQAKFFEAKEDCGAFVASLRKV